ncbi:unnamed protein product [Clonostachys byssicola]|uniref:Uncharacterized protein n=1 Tax=Clonostachys byssicola TaxID=160290 RepID=A0A9N9UCE3_9HYPO|nr:unnamed protein product [Clonostachys byssicola]
MILSLTAFMVMLLSPTALIVGISLCAVLLFYKFIIFPAFVSNLSNYRAPHWSCHIAPFWFWCVKYFYDESRILHQNHLAKGVVLRLTPRLLSVGGIEEAFKPLYLRDPNARVPKYGYIPGYPIYGADNLFTFEDDAAYCPYNPFTRKPITANIPFKSPVLSALTAPGPLKVKEISDKEESYGSRFGILCDMFTDNSPAHDTSGNIVAYAHHEPQKKLGEELEPLLKFPRATGESPMDADECPYWPNGRQSMDYTHLSSEASPGSCPDTAD